MVLTSLNPFILMSSSLMYLRLLSALENNQGIFINAELIIDDEGVKDNTFLGVRNLLLNLSIVKHVGNGLN